MHNCSHRDLARFPHHEERVDWDRPYTAQWYIVYRCRVCQDFWGNRYKWDANDGPNHKWERFEKDPELVKKGQGNAKLRPV